MFQVDEHEFIGAQYSSRNAPSLPRIKPVVNTRSRVDEKLVGVNVTLGHRTMGPRGMIMGKAPFGAKKYYAASTMRLELENGSPIPENAGGSRLIRVKVL